MTWFRIDDNFWQHQKMWDASSDAVALWVRAGSWSGSNLTDGFIPRNMLTRLSPVSEDAARELVQRGMWRHVPGGYQFHDWHEWNPTKAEVEERRRSGRERQREYRKRQENRNASLTPKSRRQSRVTNGVTPDSPQVNEAKRVTRQSHHPDPDSYESYGRADGAPDGPVPAPGSPEAREVNERGYKMVMAELAKRRNGKGDGGS